jgi:hypothetical protein
MSQIEIDFGMRKTPAAVAEVVTEKVEVRGEGNVLVRKSALGTSPNLGTGKTRTRSDGEVVTERGIVGIEKSGMQNEIKIRIEKENEAVLVLPERDGIRIRESLKKVNGWRGESAPARVTIKRKGGVSQGITRRRRTEGIKIEIVNIDGKRIEIKTRIKISTSTESKLKRNQWMMIMDHTTIWRTLVAT